MWIQAAGPFLVGIVLLLAGSLVGKSASKTVIDQTYRPALDRIPRQHRPLDVMPETVENMLTWAIDATQLLGIVVAPAVGLFFFAGDVNNSVTVLYTVTLLLAFLATFWFVTRVNPVNYCEMPLGTIVRNRMIGVKKWRLLTPVTIVGIGINLAAAILAAALTAI